MAGVRQRQSRPEHVQRGYEEGDPPYEEQLSEHGREQAKKGREEVERRRGQEGDEVGEVLAEYLGAGYRVSECTSEVRRTRLRSTSGDRGGRARRRVMEE
jgi:hypothetical protein